MKIVKRVNRRYYVYEDIAGIFVGVHPEHEDFPELLEHRAKVVRVFLQQTLGSGQAGKAQDSDS